MQVRYFIFGAIFLFFFVSIAGCGGQGSNVVIEHPPRSPDSYDDGPDEDR
jgi:hypothetical protein